MTTNSFKGKKAIVIGGSSGIGKATAKQLLICGATVYIVSRDQTSLDSATNELQNYGNVLIWARRGKKGHNGTEQQIFLMFRCG